MAPLYAPIAGEILDLINRLVCCDSPSQFELYSLNRRIQQLERLGHSASLSFRGAYYSLQGDFDRAEECHEKAIAENPEGYKFFNYAMTLQLEGKYAQAVVMLLRAKELCSANLFCMGILLQNAAWSGQIEVLKEWLPKYRSLLKDDDLTVDKCIELFGPVKTNPEPDESYAATCASGVLSDWDRPEEDEAWQHLQ